MNELDTLSSSMTPFGEQPQASTTTLQITSTSMEDNAELPQTSTVSSDPVTDLIDSMTQTILKTSSYTEQSNDSMVATTTTSIGDASTTLFGSIPPRLMGEPWDTTWFGEDRDMSANSTLPVDPNASESHIVLILSIVTASGVLLVLAMLLAIVIVCRLRRFNGTEPQLLTFSLSPNTASGSNCRSIRGIVNQAYENEFSSFDSLTDSVTSKTPEGYFPAHKSQAASAHAVDEISRSASPFRLKQLKSPKGKAPNPGSVKKSSKLKTKDPQEGGGFGIHDPVSPSLDFHLGNGISECVNPLFGKDRNKPIINFPLESISEDDVENSDEGGESTNKSGPVVKNSPRHHDSILLDDVSSTFPDVDHKSLDNVPGINMADTASNTQSCPNTPLMYLRGDVPGETLDKCKERAAWTSESNLKIRADDDRSFRGSDHVNITAMPREEVIHGSWRGDLDETWEAKTSL